MSKRVVRDVENISNYRRVFGIRDSVELDSQYASAHTNLLKYSNAFYCPHLWEKNHSLRNYFNSFIKDVNVANAFYNCNCLSKLCLIIVYSQIHTLHLKLWFRLSVMHAQVNFPYVKRRTSFYYLSEYLFHPFHALFDTNVNTI